MKIFGEEYGFALTVGASAEIAEMCPNGDIKRIGEILDGRYSQTLKFLVSFIVAMAKGYDAQKWVQGEDITHRPLTEEMVLALPNDVFKEVQSAAFEAFHADMKTSVEVAPSKKKATPKG